MACASAKSLEKRTRHSVGGGTVHGLDNTWLTLRTAEVRPMEKVTRVGISRQERQAKRWDDVDFF